MFRLYVLLFLFLAKSLFGADIPPSTNQEDPSMFWRGPETPPYLPVPKLDPIGGDVQFRVLVTDLFSPGGDMRLSNFEITAAQILCKESDITCFPVRAIDISLPTSVVTSINPPVLRSGFLSDAFITGTMTLPGKGFWRFEATADFGGQKITAQEARYIPEPSSLLLVTLGLALLPMFRRSDLR